ncbi:unnamed protein product [Closterium sp. NIES-64]|nr:unnamed protein product [Closterium sp. NIES-64]
MVSIPDPIVPSASQFLGMVLSHSWVVAYRNLASLNLKGSLHSDMSKLTALTAMSVRLFSFPSHSYLKYNYLTGTIPLLPTTMSLSLFENNYLTDVATPTGSCFGTNNCFSNPAKCPSSGTQNRPAAECAICGTTNGIAPLCWGAGGECVPDSASRIASGSSNSYFQPLLPMLCSALLALKASLGVTFTSWAATVPCQVVGKQTTLATWSGMLCNDVGGVVST